MAEVDKLEKSSSTELKSFTLEAVFSLGSHLHAKFIGEMSSNANKERENDQVAVSTMKASRFYAAFKGSIDKWEHILLHGKGEARNCCRYGQQIAGNPKVS